MTLRIRLPRWLLIGLTVAAISTVATFAEPILLRLASLAEPSADQPIRRSGRKNRTEREREREARSATGEPSRPE